MNEQQLREAERSFSLMKKKQLDTDTNMNTQSLCSCGKSKETDCAKRETCRDRMRKKANEMRQRGIPDLPDHIINKTIRDLNHS